jgi:hypothetical protein
MFKIQWKLVIMIIHSRVNNHFLYILFSGAWKGTCNYGPMSQCCVASSAQLTCEQRAIFQTYTVKPPFKVSLGTGGLNTKLRKILNVGHLTLRLLTSEH